MLCRSDLKGHQEKTSKFIVDKAASGGCMCWLDVGGGKTVSTLDAIATLSDNFCFNKCLVVSTKRIVKDVWPNEIKLWEQTHDMDIVTREQMLAARRDRVEPEYLQAKIEAKRIKEILLRKGVKKAGKALVKEYHSHHRVVRKFEQDHLLSLEGDFYLINIENYRWLVNTLGSKWMFDTQVLDESSLFRNSASKRFKAAKSIKPYVSNTIQLTGTPAPNGYMGLWSQCFLIDGGERLGKTITSFRNKYFTKSHNGFTYEPNKGSHEIIRDKIKDIVISLDPKDYMEIGEDPIHEKIKLVLPDNLRKQYKKLENDYFLEILGDPILAKTEAVKNNKLRQFCNGAVYSQKEDEDTRKVVDIHDIKIQALKEIVDISVGNPLIVAYEYITEKEKILSNFPNAVTIDNFCQKSWDAGEIEILVLHPKSGGHGLNLQHGGHRVVWFPTMVDLELYDQLNGRVNELRQAQSGYFKAPIYYHLYFEKTIEEDLIKRRSKKDATQRTLVKAMGAGIKSRSRGAKIAS